VGLDRDRLSLEAICAFDHDPVRMTVKGRGKMNYSWVLACPTCNTSLDIVGNGLYCGRCGDRMKRIEKATFCPTCRYEVIVPEYIRPSMVSLVNTKAPPPRPTPQPRPAAPPQPPQPRAPLPEGVDASALEGLIKLLDLKGSVEISQAVAIIKLRTKQDRPDVEPYVRALEQQGRARREGDRLVKIP
jgi:hypothetical protein